MKPIPMTRLSIISPTIQFLEDIGTPTQQHLTRTNIPLEALEKPETLIPLSMAMGFLDQAARSEGIENLGIAMGKSAKISDLGMLGHLVCQSFTLYDILQRLCHFSRAALSESGDKLWLIENVDHIWFCQQFPHYNSGDIHLDHSVYYSLMLQLDCVRMALGDHWQPAEIYLPTSPYPKLVERAELWDTQIHFNKPFTAIHIPRRLLGTPTAVPKTTAHDSKEDWMITSPASDFIGSLEQTLSTLLLCGYPTIELAAAASGFSVRTLQRKLAQQNLTYSRLMDKIRYQKAVSIMQNPDIPFIEIAYALGFKDPASFSHSFRRWTGSSPRQFRKQQLTTAN